MADVPLSQDIPPRRIRQGESEPASREVGGVRVEGESTREVQKETPISQEVQKEAPREPQQIPTTTPTPAPVYSAKDPLVESIEQVLSEDLTDAFLSLSPEKQAIFKAKGEETAGAIQKLLVNAHANAKKIFSLIRAWLKLLPGVNRFFLEQEAKIKTDKIIRLS